MPLTKKLHISEYRMLPTEPRSAKTQFGSQWAPLAEAHPNLIRVQSHHVDGREIVTSKKLCRLRGINKTNLEEYYGWGMPVFFTCPKGVRFYDLLEAWAWLDAATSDAVVLDLLRQEESFMA